MPLKYVWWEKWEFFRRVLGITYSTIQLVGNTAAREKNLLREAEGIYKGGTGTSATRRSFSRPFVRCVCWSTKGSVRGIKCLAGAGVIVVESKQAREARLLEAQAESLLRICDLRHGRFNKPNALRINTRRHLLNRSSPKPTRRTRTAQRPDPWCHHPHHQVVDFPEDRLAINHFVCQSRKTSLPFN
jgi:hypothetical protein